MFPITGMGEYREYPGMVLIMYTDSSAYKRVGIGFGIAAAAALAQMGLAWGFGLLSWSDMDSGALQYRHSANTAWVTWFAAVSVVVGGMASGMMGSKGEKEFPVLARLSVVVASAVGGFITGPLVSLAARQGTEQGDFPISPIISSALGALVGLALTLIALGSLAVAVNVGASVTLVWVFAVLDSFTDIGRPAGPGSIPAVWGQWGQDIPQLEIRGLTFALPFIAGSFLIGAVVAGFSRSRPISSSGYRIAAASGIAGPLVITVAHFAGGPAGTDAEAMALLNVGPTACIAGILGSLLISALPRSGGQIDDHIEQSTPSANGNDGRPNGAGEGRAEDADETQQLKARPAHLAGSGFDDGYRGQDGDQYGWGAHEDAAVAHMGAEPPMNQDNSGDDMAYGRPVDGPSAATGQGGIPAQRGPAKPDDGRRASGRKTRKKSKNAGADTATSPSEDGTFNAMSGASDGAGAAAPTSNDGEPASKAKPKRKSTSRKATTKRGKRQGSKTADSSVEDGTTGQDESDTVEMPADETVGWVQDLRPVGNQTSSPFAADGSAQEHPAPGAGEPAEGPGSEATKEKPAKKRGLLRKKKKD